MWCRAEVRIRPRHPPAVSLVSGLLGSVSTPGSGGGGGQGVVYTNEARFLPPSTEELPTPSVSHILFSEGIVRRELEALNESKSPGPDEIPPRLLKELASELSVPLSMLFQTSFDTGTLPIDWKLAHITPLYKGGSRASTTNYRPISLTCILCKVMERIMKNELIDFLEVHGLLSNCQHGFRKGRSCTTNLLHSLQSWTRALDDRHEVHIAFIDFQKAFDTVPHQKLLHKLKKIGIGGNFLKWIENFILGRHQVVCIGQGKSDPAMVGSGVPQGSVLGPILFLIYVDDAARALDCEVAMFAGDMKIWSVIRSPADEDRLQANLNRLEEWSNRWLLRFNVGKYSILRLGNTARSAITRDYFLGGAALQEVEAQKDLGVLTTSSLKPSAHCSRVAKSAMSVLYFTVAVEGNIGCGKSTFLKFFEGISPNIEISLEPIGLWNNVKGHKLFEIFYGDPVKWSTPFESQVLVTFIDRQAKPQVAPVRLMERSIHSGRHCFIEAMNQNKQMSDDDLAVIDEFYKWGRDLSSAKLDLIVYLRCSPEVCAERIRKRDRRGERAISMDYLQQLHDLHEKWLLGGINENCPAPVLIFDCDKPLEILTSVYYERREQVMCGVKV
ncbi:hypothetical protein SprV_0602215400 [Sparganum proliferum]